MMLRTTRLIAQCFSKNWFACNRMARWRTNHNCHRMNNFLRKYSYSISVVQIRHFSKSFGPLASCWSCKYSYPVHSINGEMTFFCPSCKVVQQPQDKTSYFDIMECEPSFDLDAKVLTNNFRKLQSQLHPDKFTLKSEREQNLSSLQSSVVNEAYQMLLKPLSRGIYLLNMEGLSIEEGNIAIDIDFLADVMEMNEILEKGSKSEITKLKKSNKENLEWCIDEASKAFKNNDLMTAKEILSKMKYFDNINQQIKEKLMVD